MKKVETLPKELPTDKLIEQNIGQLWENLLNEDIPLELRQTDLETSKTILEWLKYRDEQTKRTTIANELKKLIELCDEEIKKIDKKCPDLIQRPESAIRERSILMGHLFSALETLYEMGKSPDSLTHPDCLPPSAKLTD